MYCKCSLCQERKEFINRLQDVPIEHHEFFETLYDKYDDVKAVADYYKMKYQETLDLLIEIQENN